MATYVYAIIGGEEPVGRIRTTIRGLEEAEVETVPYRSIAAVVSKAPLECKVRREMVLAHQKVLEQLMGRYTVLPVRYGSRTSDEADLVEEVLRPREAELHTLVARMRGKAEFGLRGFYRKELVFREVVEDNPVIRRLRDKIAQLPPEQGHRERVRVGEMVQSALGARKERDAEKIMRVLGAIFSEHKINAAYGDENLLNASFLLDREQETEFDAWLARLEERLAPTIGLKCVGPMPPFNFVCLTIQTKSSHVSPR